LFFDCQWGKDASNDYWNATSGEFAVPEVFMLSFQSGANVHVHSIKKSIFLIKITVFLLSFQVLHSALFTFDLIESVLARVEELIEVKVKAVMDENI